MVKPQKLRLFRTILLCAGLCVLAWGCQDPKPSGERSEPTSTKRYGGVYRYALGTEPITLDPARVRDIYALSVIQQVFDGLVQFDDDLDVIPGLARFWEVSSDRLTWTFHIRPGVKFHNGREVTAEDFVYSFTRLMEPKTGAPSSWFSEHVRGAKAFIKGEAEKIDGLRALDRYTLQILLSKPYVPFLSTLASFLAKVVPWEDVERLGNQFGRQPVGTGPFRFVDWTPGQEIRLQANEAYFEGRPFLDQLRYPFFPGERRQAILPAFKKGEVEDAPVPIALPIAERQRFVGNSHYRFFRKPILATLFLWLNTSESPLNNPKVRRAINLAIDHQRIHSTIRQNLQVQARGILPPGIRGYNPNRQGYPYDPAQARQLLSMAGYPQGNGLPPIELWSVSAQPMALAELKAIQEDLQQVGITVELRNINSWKDYITHILGKRPGAMCRYAWYADIPDPDNFLFVLFHSQGAYNYANYRNPQVDRLLEEARREPDKQRRIEIYRKAEDLIMQDAPIVPLVHFTFERLFHSYVNGIELSILGRPYIPMKKIWLDTPFEAQTQAVRDK